MANLRMPAEVMVGRNDCEATCAYQHDGEDTRAYNCDSEATHIFARGGKAMLALKLIVYSMEKTT